MIVAIADTHAVIWYLFSDPRLGKAASAFGIGAKKMREAQGRIACARALAVELTR